METVTKPIKFVCISDTHGMHSAMSVPEGDVLIHAGDFITYGVIESLVDFIEFIRK